MIAPTALLLWGIGLLAVAGAAWQDLRTGLIPDWSVFLTAGAGLLAARERIWLVLAMGLLWHLCAHWAVLTGKMGGGDHGLLVGTSILAFSATDLGLWLTPLFPALLGCALWATLWQRCGHQLWPGCHRAGFPMAVGLLPGWVLWLPLSWLVVL